jgi:hypothetical protein
MKILQEIFIENKYIKLGVNTKQINFFLKIYLQK